MIELNLDFLDCLADEIESLQSTPVSVGLLDVGESISVSQMQGGDERRFFNGARDKNMNIQIAIKGKNSSNCYDNLSNIAYSLSNSTINSKNGSYEFLDMNYNGEVSLISQDEDKYFIYAVNMIASLHIKKGVVL